MLYVIPAPEIVSLPVQGETAKFPVHNVYCVGQNYAAHAIEMGSNPERQHPFFFCKSPEAVSDSAVFVYPALSQDVQHEIELVVALKSGGTDIAVEQALEHVYGYAVGLDMTRRDLQSHAKKAGRPWETAKAFQGSAPCSAIVPAAKVGHPQRGAVWLDLNGQRQQTGDLQQMIWKVPEIISELSRYFDLAAGDLIFTGTPSGVGAVRPGDRITGGIDGVAEIEVEVVSRKTDYPA